MLGTKLSTSMFRGGVLTFHIFTAVYCSTYEINFVLNESVIFQLAVYLCPYIHQYGPSEAHYNNNGNIRRISQVMIRRSQTLLKEVNGMGGRGAARV